MTDLPEEHQRYTGSPCVQDNVELASEPWSFWTRRSSWHFPAGRTLVCSSHSNCKREMLLEHRVCKIPASSMKSFSIRACSLQTWGRRPRASSWKPNMCASWSGSSHWSLGKAVLRTASPRHPSAAASDQVNLSSLQTWLTSVKRCSPLWTLLHQGCWAWMPVLPAPTSLWPTESQRYLKTTNIHYFSTALKIKLQQPRALVTPKTRKGTFTSLVETLRKPTAAREHIQCAIFRHFKCLWFILSILWFLCCRYLSFAFTF